MKSVFIFLLASWFIKLTALAQGLFAFGNRSMPDGIDAPVFDGIGGKLSGSSYLTQLWGGPDANSLAPLGDPVPFHTGVLAGYIRTVTVAAPNIIPGAQAVVEMRAWRVAAGPTFFAAFASADANPLGNYGKSNQLLLRAGGVFDPINVHAGFPAPLVGLRSFCLAGNLAGTCVPEPSSVLLVIAGAGLLWFCRWR